jgi:hypothetical protein
MLKVYDMPNVPQRPVSEHPKDVRRWVLECLAVLWTESGTGWNVDAKKNLLIRSEEDFTFEIFLRPSQRVMTGFVTCFPHWRIRSQRFYDWKSKRQSAPKWPCVFDTSLRELRGPGGHSPSQWLFLTPIGIEALYEPSKILDGRAPLQDLRRDVSPIFNAIFDPDAFAELVHSTNLSNGFMIACSERAEYFLAIGRADLAQAEVNRYPRACSHQTIIDLGLSIPAGS